MNWISTRDRLPREGDRCWIYGSYDIDCSEKFVFDGYFKTDCRRFNGGKVTNLLDHEYDMLGWEYDPDHGDRVLINSISHWMPYFTPKPPEGI